MIGESSPASSYNTSVAMEFFRFAGRPKTFAKGRKIFSENQRGIPFLLMPNRMYLLLDGEVGIFSRDKPVATVRPGQIFGETASLDLLGREYFVSRIASASTGGHDNILRADTAFTVRIYRQHAIALKYVWSRRNATFPDLGNASQTRGTIGIFYTYLGHDRFGAVEWR